MNILDSIKVVEGLYDLRDANIYGQLADLYSNASTYEVGDYCIYEYQLYKCITAVTTAEEFDSTKWKQTTVIKEILQLTEEYTKLSERSDKLEEFTLLEKYNEHAYGIRVNFNTGDVVRLYAAENKSAGTDFNDAPPFGGRKKINLSNTGKILAYYGDENYVEDGTNGQVMVYQPKVYYKVVPLKLEEKENGLGYNLIEAEFYVSDIKIDDSFKVHPAFIAGDKELDWIAMSAYEAGIYSVDQAEYIADNSLSSSESYKFDTSNDRLASVANVMPISGYNGNLTRAVARNLAANRGSNWFGYGLGAAALTGLLFAIEYATFDSQTAIGMGPILTGSSNNGAPYTGATAALGNGSGVAESTKQFDGSYSSEAKKSSVTYRGEENLWGSLWNFVDGINVPAAAADEEGGIPKVNLNYTYSEGENATGYESIGFSLPDVRADIKYFGYSENYDWTLLPGGTGARASNPGLIVDDFNISQTSAYRIVDRGNDFTSGSSTVSERNPGIFGYRVAQGTGSTSRAMGTRFVYAPVNAEVTDDTVDIIGLE